MNEKWHDGNEKDGNQGKHRVTKRGPALSNPMFTLVTSEDIAESHYNETLQSALDEAAPPIHRTTQHRWRQPWHTLQTRFLQRCSRCAERLWRKSNLPEDFIHYKFMLKTYNSALHLSKQTYFKTLITSLSNKPKRLFDTFQSLLNPRVQAPTTDLRADDLANYFKEKIDHIQQEIISQSLHTMHCPPSPTASSSLSDFEPVTEEESLHWLPIHSRIQYKTTTLIHKALHGSAPPYIALVSVYHPTRALRSADDLRYELPAPSSGQRNDITAWQECVNNSMAQLEHQAVRIENLEIMSQHGCNAWRVYNENLVRMIESAQKDLQKLRKRIQDLNWQRKNSQLTSGAKLREMESTSEVLGSNPTKDNIYKEFEYGTQWPGGESPLLQTGYHPHMKRSLYACAHSDTCSRRLPEDILLAFLRALAASRWSWHQQHFRPRSLRRGMNIHYLNEWRHVARQEELLVSEPDASRARRKLGRRLADAPAVHIDSIYAGSHSIQGVLLGEGWVSLVSKNYEIERAIVQLENEINQLKQRDGENKENIENY
ncbi:unnamed protein product [Ranitomeya imitator]|uniref:Pre-mRNA-splicing factor SPF27 n=1 Tax=Ranitomeya imitator TaxID=111125 RepID=A0ABN9LGR2_9NEOB|nr:unnamed protein product [Ranitomeya imitator]